MKIHGAGQGPAGPANHGQQIKAAQQQAEAAKAAKTETKEHTAPERARGVIRLLQEGHFKGVADVRLRINFADELTALSQSSLRAAADGDVSALLEAVDAEVTQFLEAGEFDDAFVDAVRGAQDAFETSVKELVAVFGDESDPQAGDLLAGIQAAYDSFVSALTEVFTPETPAPVDGETEVLESEAGAPVSLSGELQSFLDKLTAAFDSALANFGDGLDQASTVLPPLSEPSGNGAAYEKFLAILNGLNGTGSDGDAPSGDLDTAV